MRDLNEISRANGRAVALNITTLRAGGCWVVVERAGLHVMDCVAFSGATAEVDARAKLDEINARGGSVHGELLEPKPQILGTFATADSVVEA